MGEKVIRTIVRFKEKVLLGSLRAQRPESANVTLFKPPFSTRSTPEVTIKFNCEPYAELTMGPDDAIALGVEMLKAGLAEKNAHETMAILSQLTQEEAHES